MQDAVRLEGVSVARGGVTILEGITVAVHPGEALILIGANGIGKTSLLRTIVGLQKPVAGQVQIDPDDVIYASHLDGVKPTLSVEENLRFWAQIFGRPFDPKVLDMFDLAVLANRPGNTLSAGQKRRAGLARLAVAGRGVMCLDEPTVSLDRASIALFTEYLKRALERGASAIIATHIDMAIPAKTLDLTPHKARQFQSAFAGDDW